MVCLLNAGAEVGTKNKVGELVQAHILFTAAQHGDTALVLAIKHEQPRLAMKIIEMKADVNETSNVRGCFFVLMSTRGD